jgi:hypothetical protein
MNVFRIVEDVSGRHWLVEILPDGTAERIPGGGPFYSREDCRQHFCDVEQSANGYWTESPPPMDGTHIQAKYLDEDPIIVWWSQDGAEWKSDNRAVQQPSKWRPIPE